MSFRSQPKAKLLAALLLLFVGLPNLPLSVAARTSLKSNEQQQTSNINLPQGVERVTSVEGITEYRLPNGLRVLLFPDQTKQTITVNITYLVGSRHENYGETGMAHLLEHLVFKGTPRHPNIPQELTQHGARPNGTTSFDRTNYFETFAATDENLNWALDLESDRMVNSFIAKKDLDSEFSVVRNEMESGENDPLSILIQRVMATAYEWHNYGKETIGARSDVENVPIDKLQAFYKKYYQPDNAVLTVAGKIDEQKVIDLVNKYFGSIPKPERKLPPIYTIEPTQDGERQVTLRRVGDTQWVLAGYHVPPGSHPDYAAVNLMVQVLGNTPAGRLYKNLVETKKATSTLGFGFSLKEPGYVLFGAEVKKDDSLDAARDALLQTIDGMVTTPPTKEEVERVRGNILKNIELTLNNSEIVGLQMSNWIAQGDWRLYFLNRDRLRKASVEDVQRVAAKYLKQSNRTLGLFLPTDKPDRAEIPPVSNEEIVAMVKDYKGDAKVAEGEAFDPSPANIELRTTRSNTGGLQMALLPKKTRGGSVILRLLLRMGDEKSLMNRAEAGNFSGAMLMRGTTKHTRQQIQDELDRIKSRGFVGGGATSVSASFETTRENLPALMRLITEILREPAFPVSEFEQLKQQQITGIESQRSEPIAIALNEFSRYTNPYPKGDVRYVGTFDEQIANIKAVTLDDMKKFYQDFYGASNGQLTIIGDFDAKEISALANELFGNWKNKTPYKRIATEYRDFAVVNKAFETPDKANAFFWAYQPLKLRDDDLNYAALTLGGYMLGGGFLNSRLAVRIRQKEGISYGVGGGISASSLDQVGSLTANAIYAPQNVDRLEAAFKEEIEKIVKDGFTSEELEAAKKGWLQQRQVSRSQDNELAGRLNSYLFLNRTLAWDEDFEKKVAALTPEQVNAAIRKFIDPNKIIVFKAGDFANAKAKANAAKPNQ
jgi:zinc protease